MALFSFSPESRNKLSLFSPGGPLNMPFFIAKGTVVYLRHMRLYTVVVCTWIKVHVNKQSF